jgi:hypothetical protein
MNKELLLFAVISFASVLLYYPVANSGKFVQRSVTDFETTYWNAFQVFLWSLAIIVFRNGPVPSIWASLAVLPTTLIYGLISEQPGMDFALTGDSPLSSTQIGVLSGIGVLVFFYIIVLFYNQDYQNPISIVWKFLPLLIFIIWLLTWLGVDKRSSTSATSEQHEPAHNDAFGKYVPGGTLITTTTTDYKLHVNHWIICTLVFLLENDSALYSQIIGGIFWGVFCQEAAAYGIALPSDSKQEYAYRYQPDAPVLGPGGTQQLVDSWQAHYTRI